MFSKQFGNDAYGVPRHGFYASKDAGFFSSSLPVFPNNNGIDFHQSEQGGRYEFSVSDKIGQDKDPLEDFETRAVGTLLPDDEDELLAGIMDDFYLNELPSKLEDLEEYDIFGSGEGMELDIDSQPSLVLGMNKVSIAYGVMTNGIGQYTPSGGTGGAVSGEHPYGEHPSRTLFVRNINSAVGDSELRSLFEEYGDIRNMYTACKHRGFVMISYYDIRASRTAMRALQNKPLGRRKLDIHFSIPKDNPSDKDANQGTLVVFNLDASVSNDELLQIFGDYGEVKEIRETPHKRHHKFIVFYDVRDAEAALKALNRCEIRGKHIKLEPSRPGGARRNLGIPQQLNQDLEQDEAWNFPHQVGLSATNSPPGNWAHLGSPIEPNPLHSLSKSPVLGSPNLMKSNNLPVLPPCITKPSVIRSDQGRINHVNHINPHSGSPQGVAYPGPKIVQGSLSNPFGSNGGDQVYGGHSNSALSSYQLHHVGSAPTGIPPERHFGYFGLSPDFSFMDSISTERTRLSHRDGNYQNGSDFSTMTLPRHSPTLIGNGSYPGLREDGLAERIRSWRIETTGSQMETKQQNQLDLEKIIMGEDTRTTLMIKNIPNKYTSTMLLAAIDENHRGTNDFLYLPIDFKNKCNVGFAFINMVSSMHILPFYKTFDGKKWEKFNSAKVASLAYARIQGKNALITHFENSVMNEDKQCRPILFHSES